MKAGARPSFLLDCCSVCGRSSHARSKSSSTATPATSLHHSTTTSATSAAPAGLNKPGPQEQLQPTLIAEQQDFPLNFVARGMLQRENAHPRALHLSRAHLLSLQNIITDPFDIGIASQLTPDAVTFPKLRAKRPSGMDSTMTKRHLATKLMRKR